VPESFITQMHSLVGAEEGIQFYSCFISYSSKDEEFARRLHGRMRDAHLRVWFAPEDIQGGQKLHEQIETAIRVYDKLLIVLSEASLQSEWVMTELRKARKAERQSGKRKLFPVRLTDYQTLEKWECHDSKSGKDLAEELRQYFIPDFSNWKEHDLFEAAFARLLKDLRAETTAAGAG
jgi:TIR domain